MDMSIISTLVVGDMAATAEAKSLARRDPTKSAARAKALHDSEFVTGTVLIESSRDVENHRKVQRP